MFIPIFKCKTRTHIENRGDIYSIFFFYMERAPAGALGALGALTPYFHFFFGPLGPQILIAVLLS